MDHRWQGQEGNCLHTVIVWLMFVFVFFYQPTSVMVDRLFNTKDLILSLQRIAPEELEQSSGAERVV